MQTDKLPCPRNVASHPLQGLPDQLTLRIFKAEPVFRQFGSPTRGNVPRFADAVGPVRMPSVSCLPLASLATWRLVVPGFPDF